MDLHRTSFVGYWRGDVGNLKFTCLRVCESVFLCVWVRSIRLCAEVCVTVQSMQSKLDSLHVCVDTLSSSSL